MIEINNEVYVINNHIIFSPLQRVLHPANSEDKHSIQTPACLCLVFLLRHQGSVVTRENLINFAWGDGAVAYVTNNTFYQTISHLRKILDAVGCDNMVTTIPRIGLTIGSEHSIELRPHEIISTPDAPALPVAMLPAPPRAKKNVLFILLCIVIFMLPAVIGKIMSGRQDVFAHWSVLPGQSCEVRYRGENDVARIEQEMRENNISCQGNHALFITLNPQIMRTSFVICQAYSSRKQQCQVLLINKRASV